MEQTSNVLKTVCIALTVAIAKQASVEVVTLVKDRIVWILVLQASGAPIVIILVLHVV